MSNIKVFRNSIELPFKSFLFPGGEVGIKLDTVSVAFVAKTGFFAPSSRQTIVARIQSSKDLIELAMVQNALKQIDDTPTELFLPYVPYARQDRTCAAGESFSLEVFCAILNGLNFQKVFICDPHSDVSPALIRNRRIISQVEIANKYLTFSSRAGGCVLVSPDAGSNKKISSLAKYFGHTYFARADKLRDLETGKILETIVYCDDFKGRDVCIVDDICDGGRTFIELVKVLRAKNCGKIVLYVTFGIFSNGVKYLFDNGIDEIYTTNGFKWASDQNHPQYDDKVNKLNLDEVFGDYIG